MSAPRSWPILRTCVRFGAAISAALLLAVSTTELGRDIPLAAPMFALMSTFFLALLRWPSALCVRAAGDALEIVGPLGIHRLPWSDLHRLLPVDLSVETPFGRIAMPPALGYILTPEARANRRPFGWRVFAASGCHGAIPVPDGVHPHVFAGVLRAFRDDQRAGRHDP